MIQGIEGERTHKKVFCFKSQNLSLALWHFEISVEKTHSEWGGVQSILYITV